MQGFSCSEACGIFPNQGSNPCLLHWPADSLPLAHQGSPVLNGFLLYFKCYILGKKKFSFEMTCFCWNALFKFSVLLMRTVSWTNINNEGILLVELSRKDEPNLFVSLLCPTGCRGSRSLLQKKQRARGGQTAKDQLLRQRRTKWRRNQEDGCWISLLLYSLQPKGLMVSPVEDEPGTSSQTCGPRIISDPSWQLWTL